jgi:hypothetical protein
MKGGKAADAASILVDALAFDPSRRELRSS